jgi:hypothetical protein
VRSSASVYEPVGLNDTRINFGHSKDGFIRVLVCARTYDGERVRSRRWCVPGYDGSLRTASEWHERIAKEQRQRQLLEGD